MASDHEDRAYILAVGFGTTVAMWAVGYVGRMPAILAPSAALLALMLLCQLGGGFVAGRYSQDGWRSGVLPALLSSVLNLLVLGGLLGGDHPNTVVPSAVWWIPGSALAAAILGAAGAWLGSRFRSDARVSWTAVFVRVATVATFLLLVVGGLVTSNDAGLAVVDWPNSYGYNMFLYPIARMTGGIYYEHAHRLFGSLVGLTTLVLAIHLQRVERRWWLRRLSLAALALVVAQGILGGLRVTETNVVLAVVHGVTAQIFFATLVSMSVFTSTAWIRAEPAAPAANARTDRRLGAALLALVMLQLVLGAIVRHLSQALVAHVASAIAVAFLAVLCWVRAERRRSSVLRRTGRLLLAATTAQILLGVGALAATRWIDRGPQPGTLDVSLTTAHQGMGALLLGCAVALLLWNFRLLQSTRVPDSVAAALA